TIRIWTVPDALEVEQDFEQRSDKNEDRKGPVQPMGNPLLCSNRVKHDSKNKMSTSDPFHCKLIWKGIKNKVTCLAWHPIDEGWIAYGTCDGKIGCLDVFGEAHVEFISFHPTTVTHLEWKLSQKKVGDKEEKDGGWRLYSLGDGVLNASDGWRPNEASANVNDYLTKSNSNLSQPLAITAFTFEKINPWLYSRAANSKEKITSKKSKKRQKQKNPSASESTESLAPANDELNYHGQMAIVSTAQGDILLCSGEWKVLSVVHYQHKTVSTLVWSPWTNVPLDWLQAQMHVPPLEVLFFFLHID
ncbi:gem (nuclear organelle) associated protein 5, partial [Reticulomyxa filosa]